MYITLQNLYKILDIETARQIIQLFILNKATNHTNILFMYKHITRIICYNDTHTPRKNQTKSKCKK